MSSSDRSSVENKTVDKVVSISESLCKISINIIKIIVSLLLLLIFLNFFNWIYLVEENMTIQPFETNLDDQNISGMLIADQLCCEIDKIYKISSVYSAMPKQFTLSNKLEDYTYNIPQISNKPPSLDYSLTQIGTVGLEGTSISVGNLLLSLRELSGKHRKTLTGRLDQYGSTVTIIAVFGDQSSDLTRNLTQQNQSIEELLPGMITELAFKIAFEISETGNHPKPNNWVTLKNLILAQEAYNNYIFSNDISYLHRAQDFTQLAIQNEPDYLGSYEMLFDIGLAYYRSGNASCYDDAEEIFQMTSRKKPKESALALGYLHRQMENDFNKSLIFFNKAIYIDPNYADAWYSKAVALSFLGRYNESIQACDKAIRLDPKIAAYSWNVKSNALLFLERYDDAIRAIDKSIRIDPNDANSYEAKGNLLYIQCKYDKAIQAYKKSVEIDPDSIYSWMGLGRVLAAQGEYSQAIEAYDIVTEINPNFEIAWVEKGDVFADLGKYEEAIQAYNKAVEINPNDSVLLNKKSQALKAIERNTEANAALAKSEELVQTR